MTIENEGTEDRSSARKRSPEIPRPFIKCVGGKGRLLEALMRRVPEKFGRYHERFVGGGALFWYLRREGRLSGGATLGDANERLVRTYRAVRDDVGGVIGGLYYHQMNHRSDGDGGKAWFESVRRSTPDQAVDAAVAAWLIYLNKTAYNGLYRVNAKGEFNAPFGDYPDPRILDEANLRACSRALQGVEILNEGFEGLEIVNTIFPGDLAFFDPPYAPVSPGAFVGYVSGGFGEEKQRALAAHCRKLKERGVHVIATNSDCDLVRELYPEPFWRVERREDRGNSVNRVASARGPVSELVIS